MIYMDYAAHCPIKAVKLLIHLLIQCLESSSEHVTAL